MLNFYGLSLVEDADNGTQVVKGPTFETQRKNWLTRGNHNFLRITRVLKSLCLLGLRGHACALFEVLSLIYNENRAVVGAETFGFWHRAVQ